MGTVWRSRLVRKTLKSAIYFLPFNLGVELQHVSLDTLALIVIHVRECHNLSMLWGLIKICGKITHSVYLALRLPQRQPAKVLLLQASARQLKVQLLVVAQLPHQQPPLQVPLLLERRSARSQPLFTISIYKIMVNLDLKKRSFDCLWRLLLSIYTAGVAVLGPEASGGYFTISGTISLNQANGSKLYLNIDNSGTASYKALTFGATATTTNWGLEGDTIITTNPRQLNFIACATSSSSIYTLYLQNGNDTPPGQSCTMQTIHLPCLCWTFHSMVVCTVFPIVGCRLQSFEVFLWLLGIWTAVWMNIR